MAEEEEELRARAVKQIKKKRDLAAHIFVYVLVNAFLVLIWAVTGAGFFWPVFVMAAWGIGVIMNIWDVYRAEPTEAEVRREMERLKSGRA